jgi:murein endopeptidase
MAVPETVGADEPLPHLGHHRLQALSPNCNIYDVLDDSKPSYYGHKQLCRLLNTCATLAGRHVGVWHELRSVHVRVRGHKDVPMNTASWQSTGSKAVQCTVGRYFWLEMAKPGELVLLMAITCNY